MAEEDPMVAAVEEWLVENPTPYRCKHGCERDALEARATAAEAREAKLREALRWYQDQVSKCNRMADDTARNELARDLGQRAAAALETDNG